jgi:hypothetical protein
MAMTSDKRFIERVKRIQSGRQWTPDGVVDARKGWRRSRRSARRQSRSPTIIMALAVPAALAFAGSDRAPEPVRGFFEADTTEAAMASLGRIGFLSEFAAGR